MSDQVLWFATRGAGIVSLLLFTGVVVLGLLTSVRWGTDGWPRFLTAELHRTIALLSVVFLALHVGTAIVDPFTALGIAAAVVPFASSYRPLWTGLGVIALDLLLAVLVTSLLRARLGQRAWRAIHWLAYGSWPLAVTHGLGAGSDAFAAWMLALDAACVGAVVAALAWRVGAGGSRRGLLAGVARPPGRPPARSARERSASRGG